MLSGARRQPLRRLRAPARRALQAACLLLALQGTSATACAPQLPETALEGRSATATFSNRTAQDRHEYWAPRNARLTIFAGFARLTDEYGHAILGPIRDAKGLTIHIRRAGSDKISCPAEVLLPEGEVFEDIAPRLADLDGDGMPEVIVVQSSTRAGARLAIYNRRAELVAATPPIGRAFRWLAPVGAADLDGDGFIELAYVDRPHLARLLRVWRFRNGRLTEIATAEGLTNHRIGEDFITGGIRRCGDMPEMILLSADRRRILALSFAAGKLERRDLGAFSGPASVGRLMTCG